MNATAATTSTVVRLVLAGPSRCGKSTLFLSYVEGKRCDYYRLGEGVDFRALHIQPESGGDIFNLHFWDILGDARHNSDVSTYYRDSHGILVAFDLTSAHSLLQVDELFAEVVKRLTHPVVFILVGCKYDLISERQVSYEDAAEMARSHDAAYVETSAKDMVGVEEAVSEAIEEVLFGSAGKRPHARRERESTLARWAKAAGSFVAGLVGGVKKRIIW